MNYKESGRSGSLVPPLHASARSAMQTPCAARSVAHRALSVVASSFAARAGAAGAAAAAEDVLAEGVAVLSLAAPPCWSGLSTHSPQRWIRHRLTPH